MPLKVGTGARVNILNEADYKGLKHRPKLIPRHPKLRTYNNEKIETLGICIVDTVVQGRKYPVKLSCPRTENQFWEYVIAKGWA